MKPCSLLFVVLCAATASASAQQPIYKSVMPDGKVVYGEKPAPGAKHVETIEPPPAKAGVTPLSPQDKARAEQLRQKGPAVAAQQNQLDEARQQLKAAEAALEAGKEPLEGERLGIKGGGSRLTDDYFARQKTLEGAVAAARKRVADLERR